LDHSDNHLRLGFVTEIGQAKLDDGKGTPTGEKRVLLPKECPKCSYLRPPRVSVCPNCGFKPERPEPGPNERGELVELRPDQKPAKVPSRVKGNNVLMGTRLIPKRDLYGELLCYAQQHGRKQGWAAHSYRELTGTWPNAYRDAPPIPPSMEVLSWAKAKNIRWAKAHAR
jgi:DNA repair protein RadD